MVFLALSCRVMTVSFHKYGDLFFPGSGDVKVGSLVTFSVFNMLLVAQHSGVSGISYPSLFVVVCLFLLL